MWAHLLQRQRIGAAMGAGGCLLFVAFFGILKKLFHFTKSFLECASGKI